MTKRQVPNDGTNGKSYRYSYKTTIRSRDEWIAIPVPDSGIPPQWVDAAREAIKDNKRHSSCGRRFWELSGGVMRCGGCGCALQTTGIRARGGNLHFYYRCPRRLRDGKEACPNGKNFRADDAEPKVWGFVSELLKDPERLRIGLDKMIEEERTRLHRNPEVEAAVWAKRMEECATQRERRLQQHAEGMIGLDELREKLSEIENSRKVAERELKRLGNLGAEIAALEQDKETLLRPYSNMVPEGLDALTPKERHQVYKMLRLKVIAGPDGSLEASGALANDISKAGTTCASSFGSTNAAKMRFRALLIDGTQEVRFERVTPD